MREERRQRKHCPDPPRLGGEEPFPLQLLPESGGLNGSVETQPQAEKVQLLKGAFKCRFIPIVLPAALQAGTLAECPYPLAH